MSDQETPHHITKMNYPEQGLLGYYARVRRDDRRVGKMFSVSKYGSWEKALEEAIAWRDDFFRQWEMYCSGKTDIIQYQGTNTGYPGVSVDYSKKRPRMIVNLPKEDGMKRSSFVLPEEDSDNFKKEYKKKFEKARRMVDENNRKRFGGRWYHYKKRKGLIQN